MLFHGSIFILSLCHLAYSRDQLLTLIFWLNSGGERTEEGKGQYGGGKSPVGEETESFGEEAIQAVSPVMGNVRSLVNKIDELTTFVRSKSEYREYSLMSHSYTRLFLTTMSPLRDFRLFRLLEITTSGKNKRSGLVVFVNNRWCNSVHVTIKDRI